MKIGYFIEKFPYENQYVHQKNYPCSGAEIAANELACAISKKCEKIDIFTTNVNSDTLLRSCDNITTHRYGTTFQVINRNISIASMYQTLKFDVDICHAHISTEPVFPFIAKVHSKLNHQPLVLTCHINPGASRENMPLNYQIASKVQEKMILNVFSSANVIISPSAQIMQQSPVLQKYSDKIEIIPNGIDLDAYSINFTKQDCRKKLNISECETLLLFVGNPHPNKGADILINAMVEVVRERADVQLIFVGDGKFRQNLWSLVQKLNLTEKIKFTGYVDDLQKKMYYRAADIFLLPSYFDVHPLVLLEASSYNLPLIVSDISAFYGFIENDQNGIVTRVGDVKDLSQKIIQLVDDKKYCTRLGNNARQKVEKEYTWDIIASKTMALYDNILNE